MYSLHINIAILLLTVNPSTLSLGVITATSISLSFNSGTYNVVWKRNTLVGCSDMDEGSINTIRRSTSYDIIGLEEDSSYIITVTTLQSVYSKLHVASRTVTAITLEASERELKYSFIVCSICYILLQFHLLHPVQ